MRISLCGAAGEVTGSGYLVDTGKSRLLIDFGMFQGAGSSFKRNADLGPVDPARLDAVILTHAHLDHCGRLPLLARGGFKGPIFATSATAEFAGIILEDSARIQEADTQRLNRRRERIGREPLPPLYLPADAERVGPLFRAQSYGKWFEAADGVRARLTDAGHILGSASVELEFGAGQGARRVVFSGDLGPRDVPLMNDPVRVPAGDLVFCESTYGDRDHRAWSETRKELKERLSSAAWAKERVLIPAFAIGRTQLLACVIADLMHNGELPPIPVYLDSPMGAEATALYAKYWELLDADVRKRVASGTMTEALRLLKTIRSAQESRALNESWDAGIIIAASGMCEGGRILHHLKHNLWRRGVLVLFTGYQGEGTLGRRLVDGAEYVRVLGSTVVVRAGVATVGGLSAHAGQRDLLWWLEPHARARVVLTHGEDRARLPLAAVLGDRHGVRAELPGPGAVVEI